MPKPFLILVLSALIGTQTVSAQQLRPSLRDSLQKASDLMFKTGTYGFVTVDAVLDGILELNEPYEFTYKDKRCSFKKEKLSKKQQRVYNEKFITCLKNGGMTENSTVSIRSDGVRIAEIFKTTAYIAADQPAKSSSAAWFNTPPNKVLPDRDSARHLGDLLVLNMLDDQLVDTSKKIEIKYSLGSVFVNGKKLNEEHNSKYSAMIENVNKQSGYNPDMMTFDFSAHPNKLRYPHPGPVTSDK
ncbi:hypothetical protein [Taibaiella soli]|uniref:Uncharacterized protein n=1 Tax=Taibaiella soli TaxID=1649169 RepID=A0A2W2BZK5_9BACT|nr:hypothetical protein [Taibaiella soli]PZF73283.1 hypothetical protein DN068_08930 [Taibaiella soli]